MYVSLAEEQRQTSDTIERVKMMEPLVKAIHAILVLRRQKTIVVTWFPVDYHLTHNCMTYLTYIFYFG